ncbi:unnamed protein product [Acidithrix sp. C25]|nr:unnamed protein product [Acidithrix sp. C25]
MKPNKADFSEFDLMARWHQSKGRTVSLLPQGLFSHELVFGSMAMGGCF